MRKYLPFWNYDLLATENWLNDLAAQGYTLTKFRAMVCDFQPTQGPRPYYRLRYLEEPPQSYTASIGRLYLFSAASPEDLPPANYDGDAQLCAQQSTGFFQVLAPSVLTFLLLMDWAPKALHNLPLAIACAVLLAVWLPEAVGEASRWHRAYTLASGSITVSACPPGRLNKALFLGLLPVLAFMLLVCIALGY